jgi:hypothetical protein
MRDLDGCLREIKSMLDANASSFWTDMQLTGWLEEGLSLMARSSQVIRVPIQFSTVVDQGEYKLRNVEPTDIVTVKFHDGSSLHNLEECSQDEIQTGTRRTSNIQSRYYKRLYSDFYEYIGSDGDIDITDSDPQSSQDYRCIIGLDPLPSEAGRTITVWIASDHPPLTTEANPKGSKKILLPFPYQKGACAYAAAQALQQEKFHDEAKFYYELYQDFSNQLKEYMTHNGRTGHAQVKDTYKGDIDYMSWADRVEVPDFF